MSEAKHTPGPRWGGPLHIVRSPVVDGWNIKDAHGNPAVGRTYNDPDGSRALVFAASPDLLAAAEEVLEATSGRAGALDTPTVARISRARDGIRAAIAQAKGEK